MLLPRFTHSGKLLSILIFLMLILAVTAYTVNIALAAANIVVDTNADNTTDDNLCTLREAITNANDDAQTYDDCAAGVGADTITFVGNYTITLTSALPNITTGMTIDGFGHTIAIDGDGTYRIFYVTSTGNLTVNQVTLHNGFASYGGGIYNNGGTLMVTNSTFSGNSVTYYGGGIINYGTLMVTNSTFSGNSAAAGGGGIYNSVATLTVTNSTFSGNSAAGFGGGIANYSSLRMTNSTFSGNSATNIGGGMYNSGTVHLAGNVFAVGLNGTNCAGNGTLTDNGYNLSDDSTCTNGGTGSATNATLNLDDLADNGGPTQTHALLSGSDAINAIPYDTNISNNGVTWTCNYADSFTDQRGAPRPLGNHCDIGAYESGSSFIVNTAADTNDGACDALGTGSGNMDCTLREAINAANADADASQITFANNYTITLGSTLPDITSYVDISGVGHSITVDGDNHTHGILFVESNGTLTVHSLTLAWGNFAIVSFGDLTILNSTIRDGSGDGSAIYMSGSQLIIANSTFYNNQSIFDSIIVADVGVATVNINNSTFSGNNSVYGVIYTNDAMVTINNSIITDSTGDDCVIESGGSFNGSNNLIDDHASGPCAGISNAAVTNLAASPADNGGDTHTIALLDGSNAINAGNNAVCEATDQRGVARPQGTGCDSGAFEVEVTQTGPNFVVNTNADTDDGLCDLLGQGIGNQDCTLREAIDAANANADASEITFAGDYTITLTSVLPDITSEMTINGVGHSVAVSGAGTYRVLNVSAVGNLTVNALTIANGYTSGNGGGIYNDGMLIVNNSTISGNTGDFGGGIANDNGTATVSNTTFSGNVAPTYGGGLYNNTGTVVVSNSTFSGNSVDNTGAAILNDDGSVTIISSTFSDNFSISGFSVDVIYNYFAGSTFHLAGNIFVRGGNININNCGNGSGTHYDNGYNLSDDASCGFSGTSADNATLNLGDLANNGGPTWTHALLSGSDAINAIPYGAMISNNGVTWTCNAADPFTDQRGVARPQGTSCDSGAFEVEVTQTGPNFVVNTAADTDDGFCDLSGQGLGNQDCTLREAINAANADPDASQITFAGDYAIILTAPSLNSELPQITSEITINGVGHSVTVDGNNTGNPAFHNTIFIVTLDSVLTINSLTLAHGYDTIVNFGELTVLNSTIRDGDGEVGGIYSDGAQLTIANSTFYNNYGSNVGAIQVDNGSTVINNVTFSGNSGSFAGGVQIYNNVITITNSIITNSPGSDDCFILGSGSFSGSHNLIDDNVAGACAGISSAAVTNLAASPADNGGDTHTIALLDGSNAINTGDNPSCEATDQRGETRPQGIQCDIGAFEFVYTGYQSGPNFIVNTNADTDDSSCDLLGQGLGNMDCTLREAINAANSDFDASIITFAADYTITLTSALPDITTDVTIDGNGAANTIVQASTCDPVTLPGGCTPADWRVFTFVNDTSTLTAMTVRYGNCAGACSLSGSNGGNLYAGSLDDSLTLDAVYVQSGYAAGHGGGIAMEDDGDLLLDNSQISYNQSGGYGGGVYFEDGLGGIIRNGSVIDHNRSAGNGGGIYAYGCSNDLAIEASTIANNFAEGTNGGGLLTGCGTTISDSTFSGNTAEDGDGGGIYIEATTTITNSTITDNHAADNGGSNMYGGAIYNNGTLTVVNSTLQGNTAFDNGGGIYNALGKTATLINSTLSDNVAVTGDSLYNRGTLHLSNNIIANGTSGSTCINVSGTIATDINNLIEGNNGCGTPISTADPMLGPLQYNSGSTQTMALLAGSPALDAGDNAVCAAAPVNNLDQRGMARPQGNGCDIGAYEAEFFSLTVAVTGNGTGSVSGPGIACESDCTEAYVETTVVTLTASADTGSTFTGWSGDCVGTADCVVTIDAAKNVTASFGLDMHQLTVNLAGNGSGTVSGPGINCGADCDELFDYGTVVTLTASADTNSTFTGWSGNCTGTADCVVTMDAAKNVTATFMLDTHLLTVNLAGTGSGTVSGPGINCGADCDELFDYGTVVTLTASADTGSTFTGWSGACTGTGDCDITMDTAKNVTATFALDTHLLTVNLAGTGTGTVSGPGINCGVDCDELFDYGTVVTLTASADTGSGFMGWSGACSGTGDCVVTMDEAKNVTATFALDMYLLTVNLAGTGTGTVSGPGINCGVDCDELYDYGTVVTLTASADTGSTFMGWSGACSGTGDCVVTMDEAQMVTAVFNLDATPTTYQIFLPFVIKP